MISHSWSGAGRRLRHARPAVAAAVPGSACCAGGMIRVAATAWSRSFVVLTCGRAGQHTAAAPAPTCDLGSALHPAVANRFSASAVASRQRRRSASSFRSSFQEQLSGAASNGWVRLRRCKTLHQALEHYTAKAVLDGDNKYRCPLNNKLVKAVRHRCRHHAPHATAVAGTPVAGFPGSVLF